MEDVDVGAIPAGRRPLGRRLDGGSLTPLVEGGDQLELSLGGGHVGDVRGPLGIGEACEAWGRLGVEPEPRGDGVGVLALGVDGGRRAVLMPAIGLGGAGGIPAEHLQHEVEAEGVGIVPALGHRAGIEPVGVDEDDRLAAHLEVVGVRGIVGLDVAQVGRDLRDRGIAGALLFVVRGPLQALAVRGIGGVVEQGRDPGAFAVLALAPP